MQHRETSDIQKILKSQAGLSLIEILIALTLLALAGTVIVGQVFEQLEEGKHKSTVIQMNALKQRLKEFKRHCGFYPSTEQGLEALVEKPTGGRECKKYAPDGYIDGGIVPADAWDNPFDYVSDMRKFTILSYGADGMEGGDGWDADISSDKKK